MTRATVLANGRRYIVSALEPRAAGDVFQAMVVAQVIDGLTGGHLRGGVRVRTRWPGLSDRTASGGFVGLVGTPTVELPALTTTSYDVELTVLADGYAPRSETASFVAQPMFPADFAPVDLGVLALRRSPMVIETGTYERDPMNRPVPLALATVQVTGAWATVADLAGAATATELLAVAPGLRAPRPVGAAVDVPALTLPAEPPRRLAADAAAESQLISLSATGALVAGDLLGLDLADPDLAERIEVVGVHGPADLDSPAEAELRFPLRARHRDGSLAERITAPAAAPAATTLTAEGLEGDRTLVVGSLAGLAPGAVVRISGGASADEFCTADLYDLTTDAQGFGRFPPLTGFAAVEVSAVSGALAATARLTLTQHASALDLTLM